MSNNRNVLVVITGPTAVGKSALAFALARELKTEIVSADSRQIYRQLNIGTAKPSPTELTQIKHHFINHLDLTEKISAVDYARACLTTLKSQFEQHQVLIMVGGTGLYLKAVLEGFDEIPDVPDNVQAKWSEHFETDGLASLQEVLKKVDPKHAAMVDLQNARRLIRALSVHDHTGRPYSSFLQGAKKQLPYRVVPICLVHEKEMLYQRINARVDEMIEGGLVEEVRCLVPYRDLQSLQTVGYQELFPFLDGRYDLAEAVRLIKRNTRRYAKRQMTWFRKYGDWGFLEADLTSCTDLMSMINLKKKNS